MISGALSRKNMIQQNRVNKRGIGRDASLQINTKLNYAYVKWTEDGGNGSVCIT